MDAGDDARFLHQLSDPLSSQPPFSHFSQGLKYLVRLCTDMDLPEAQEYAIALKKAESNLERRESVSGPISPVLHLPHQGVGKEEARLS
jgi:hypothetical protein